MEGTDLVNGNKELLIGEFRKLYQSHGRKWRSLLKKHNGWHTTDKGLRAWQNISNGTTGNESLRLIISDMQTIVAAERKKPAAKRLGFSKPKTL